MNELGKINRSIAKVLSEQGHQDLQMLVDAGLDNKPIRGIEIRKAVSGTKSYTIANRQVIMFPEKYRFVPIPKEEIDRSNKVLIQNPGY